MTEDVRKMWSEDELDTAPATLHSNMDSVRQEEAEPKAVSRLRRGRAWWAASATTVALVAGLLIVRIGDQPMANAAAKELNQAADKITNSDPPVKPGQYRYIATHAWWLSTAVLEQDSLSYLEEHLIETWVPADERQEWLMRDAVTGNRTWVDGSDAEAEAAGLDLGTTRPPEERRAPCGGFDAEDEGLDPCSREAGRQKPDEEFMASLPRNPNELYDRMRADTDDRGQDPNLEMLVYAADTLRTGQVPADLRAALYRALGFVPGLEVTEKVANLDGREGVAFGISAAGTRQDIIVDPGTGQFIGERQILEEGYDGVLPGTMASHTSVTTIVVNGMGEKPAG